MNTKSCQICGSTKLIADRALGGRLICSICGSSEIKSTSQFISSKLVTSKLNIIILFFTAIIIIIIIA